MGSVEVPIMIEGKPEGTSYGAGRQGEASPLEPHTIRFTAEATRPHAPPSYEEAMDPASAPPPSYESMFGRVKEVHKQSSGTFDFLKNVLLLLLGTLGCTIIVGFTIVIPLAMAIIGWSYLNQCPVNKHIPIYLLVGGIFGVSKQVLNLFERARKQNSGDSQGEETTERTSGLQNLIGCFMTVWFICGSYWVYSEYLPEMDDSSSPKFCNRTVYLFAFWQISLLYIVSLLCLCCMCLSGVGLVLFSRRLANEESLPTQDT